MSDEDEPSGAARAGIILALTAVESVAIMTIAQQLHTTWPAVPAFGWWTALAIVCAVDYIALAWRKFRR